MAIKLCRTSGFNIQTCSSICFSIPSPCVHNVHMIGRFHQREGRLWKMHAHFTSIAVNKAWVMFTAENFYCLAELHEISCISCDWRRTLLNTSILKFFHNIRSISSVNAWKNKREIYRWHIDNKNYFLHSCIFLVVIIFQCYFSLAIFLRTSLIRHYRIFIYNYPKKIG